MDKNSPLMTSEEIIDEAADICDRMEDDEKYSSGEAVMILNAAQMMMVQRQTMNVRLQYTARKKNDNPD